MLSKAFLVFGIVSWTFLLAAEDEGIEPTTYVESEIRIRHAILKKMSTYTQGLWNITPPNQNIQFFPLMDAINKNIDLIEFYYENNSARLHPHNTFLKEPLELAKLLNKMQKTPHVNLTLKSAIFADWKHVSVDYLNDVKSHYHSETFTASYAPNDTDSIQNNARRWIYDNTRGRKPNPEDSSLPKSTHFHTNALHFTACWHYPMITEEPLVFTFYQRTNTSHQQHRRFISMSKLPTTFNFDNLPQMYVDSLGQKQALKYHNDTRLGYEAISIPYLEYGFALAVVMPHVNRSLDMFLNFTADDYLHILEHISQTSIMPNKFIHYIIPALNISMVSITENGTSINQNDPVNCGPALPWSDVPRTQYKQFFVDRPYGLMLYHERTKFVLWQAWIRNPTSDVYVSRRFNFTSNPKDEELDSRHIF